jgi:hypothetical protein
MIIIDLRGGLGNQLFQFAFAKFVSLNRYKEEIFFDETNIEDSNIKISSICTDRFNVAGKKQMSQVLGYQSINLIRKFIIQNKFLSEKVINRNLILEKNFNGFKSIKDLENIYFYGYWQDYNFVKNVRDEIISSFKFNYMKIQKNFTDENLVSIHFRGGDYLSKKNSSIYYKLGDDYYQKAIKHIKNNVDNPKFIIFSNDFKNIPNSLQFLENSEFYSSNSPLNDFMFMSKCKHNITANSTFSWWASFFNTNKNKIIVMPKKWHTLGGEDKLLDLATLTL